MFVLERMKKDYYHKASGFKGEKSSQVWVELVH